MTKELQNKYNELCAQLGETEYKLTVYGDKKRQLLAEMQAVDAAAGALKAAIPAASVKPLTAGPLK